MFSPKAKQVMTSFDLAATVQELSGSLLDLRLDNVYQVSPLTLLLTFPQRRLIIEAGKRCHLTRYDVDKPSTPSQFCSIMRKYLNGGAVQRIQMDDFERIVSIEVASREGIYKLVFEIFGKGNIILVDANNIILQALSYRRMRDRDIIRGTALMPPPSRGLSPLNVSRGGI